MARSAHKDTLFHLVPSEDSPESLATLHDTRNKDYVSPSGLYGRLGFEIGFHLAVDGHDQPLQCIARLGAEGGLCFQTRPELSPLLLAFFIEEEQGSLDISVRWPCDWMPFSAIDIHPHGTNGEGDTSVGFNGRVVLKYTQMYQIRVAEYAFDLVWHTQLVGTADRETILRELVMRAITTFHMKIDATGYVSRIQLPLPPSRADVDVSAGPGTSIADGSNGTKVRKMYDARRKCFVAVKIYHIPTSLQLHTKSFRRETEVFKKAGNHPHILGCYGYDSRGFGDEHPRVYMPYREGNLRQLATAEPSKVDELQDLVLWHMLQALDFLDFTGHCHRDVRPENILYAKRGGSYHFELADFGICVTTGEGHTSIGTHTFMAPEMFDDNNQTPKMDIWGLLITIMVVHPEYSDFDKAKPSLQVVTNLAAQFADRFPRFLPMAQTCPLTRASAAQMLCRLFDGIGLTTPPSKVLEWHAPDAVARGRGDSHGAAVSSATQSGKQKQPDAQTLQPEPEAKRRSARLAAMCDAKSGKARVRR